MVVTLDLRLRIRIQGEIAMGPGKAALLEAIQQTGSISAAARQLTMSYSRAWQLVDTMNRCFRAPLVQTLRGGSSRGGAEVTPAGQEALRQYRRLEACACAGIQPHLPAFEACLVPETAV
ncbi:MAG: LysR family transcriptional regulator [Holophagaceae bacterium]|nr:LysR family transcriptional regulator [Holophagaceae bacterium]